MALTNSPTKRFWLSCSAIVALAAAAPAQEWRDVLVGFLAGVGDQAKVKKHQQDWFRNWGKSADLVTRLGSKATKLYAKVKDAEGKPEVADVKAAATALHAVLTGKSDTALDATAANKAAIGSALKRMTRVRGVLLNVAIEIGRQSGARYAGQYAHLSKLGDNAAELILHTVENPPQQVSDPARALMLGAIRDITKKLDDKQLGRVEQLAKDEFEDEGVQDAAMFLLYHCGKDALLKEHIAKIEKDAETEGEEGVRSLMKLASVWWQIAEYKAAVETYKRVISIAKDMPDQNMGSLLYNMACSQTLAGDLEGAFATLDKALTKGGKSLRDSLLEVDRDIAALRKDPRFWKLMKQHGRDLKRPEESGKSGGKPTSKPSGKTDSDKSGSGKSGSGKSDNGKGGSTKAEAAGTGRSH